MRSFSDKQCGEPRKALEAAEAKLAELKTFLDSARRRQPNLKRSRSRWAGRGTLTWWMALLD